MSPIELSGDLSYEERYLTSDDFEFTEKIINEIKAFNERQNHKRVLVFPPFLRRYRYLFHELTQKYFGQTLGTISIGTEGDRRPLLYFKSANISGQMSLKYESDSKHDSVTDSSLSVSDVKPKNSRKSGKNSNKTKDRRHRRPDMKLYVPPKAKTSSADESEDQSFAQICDQKTIESLSELEISDSSPLKAHNCLNSSSDDCIESNISKDITPNDNHNQKQITNKNEEVADESSWDTLFNEDGECVRPEFVDKVNDLICNKNCDLKLEKPRIDYFNFQYNEPEIDNSEFAHILEVYDFAIELKTQDIMTSISVFNSRDFDVKWVDDSHALIVFSNANAANEALKYVYPNIKLRPLSQAIRESKVKARKCSEFLQPYKQRPQTSALLARRLVTQSLGLRERVSPEQRAAERKKLADAKERKRMAVRQGIDVWEGNVS